MNWSPWLQFLLLVLATGHIIDLWFNGTVFAWLRPVLQTKFYLFTCAYCLTVWSTSCVLFAAIMLPNDLGWYGVMALAAMRGSWILNALLPDELQYMPKDMAQKDEEVRNDIT